MKDNFNFALDNQYENRDRGKQQRPVVNTNAEDMKDDSSDPLDNQHQNRDHRTFKVDDREFSRALDNQYENRDRGKQQRPVVNTNMEDMNGNSSDPLDNQNLDQGAFKVDDREFSRALESQEKNRDQGKQQRPVVNTNAGVTKDDSSDALENQHQNQDQEKQQ